MRHYDQTRRDRQSGMCEVPGCGKPSRRGKGWCVAHAHRARRHDGDPLGGTTPDGESMAYYLANVDRMTDECIVWPYGTGGGYGQINIDGRKYRVHILACQRHRGPMPTPGMYAAHAPVICHNPLCFNWRHLSWKPPKANSEDQILDGTKRQGETHHNAKLADRTIESIRVRYAAGGILMRELAGEYGVSLTTISRVIRRSDH